MNTPFPAALPWLQKLELPYLGTCEWSCRYLGALAWSYPRAGPQRRHRCTLRCTRLVSAGPLGAAQQHRSAKRSSNLGGARLADDQPARDAAHRRLAGAPGATKGGVRGWPSGARVALQVVGGRTLTRGMGDNGAAVAGGYGFQGNDVARRKCPSTLESVLRKPARVTREWCCQRALAHNLLQTPCSKSNFSWLPESPGDRLPSSSLAGGAHNHHKAESRLESSTALLRIYEPATSSSGGRRVLGQPALLAHYFPVTG